MNGDVEGVAPRPRPLSAGLWTLFSWLRRDDHASSNESLSSVGSDRTAASFAFLAPARYSVNNSPVFLPPPSPPTDSYRKRVQERNVRRQQERDLTLHRKYGLYRSEISNGYDAFSLPPARRVEGHISSKWERERRATSECYQRRALHVPGKRRAPLPPIRASIGAPPTRYKGPRKRPAPQPPTKLIEENNERELEANISIHMNPQTVCNDRSLLNSSTTTTDTSEKCTKKVNSSKDAKTRLDKGFLKHIFENRKKNSVIDTSAVKILPSISELDKQAATIIENVKLEALKQKSNSNKQHKKRLENSNHNPEADSWFCIKCLRKYDSSVPDCPYCVFEKKQTPIEVLKANISNDSTNASSIYTQTENGVVSQVSKSNYKIDDKQKLKEMLKEMKDSLPKRPKHENKGKIITGNNVDPIVSTVVEKDTISETPTLRIGASVAYKDDASVFTKPSTSGLDKNLIFSKNMPLESFKSVITSKPVVIQHAAEQNNTVNPNDQNLTVKDTTQKLMAHNVSQLNQAKEKIILKRPGYLENGKKIENILLGASGTNKNIQTPLRISSLLNPVYIPKNKELKTTTTEKELQPVLKSLPNNVNEMMDKPITQITAKPDNVEKNYSEFVSKSITSQIHDVTSNMSTATNKKESASITTVRDNSPVLPNVSISDVKNTNITTKIKNHEYNKNYAEPSTSTNMPTNESKTKPVDMDGLNQHIKRREFINQLEKSIANGDEHAAAEAAIKLAQLRLSCSVLSFSSQIISEPSTSSAGFQKKNMTELDTNETIKHTPHQLGSTNVIVNAESVLSSKSNTVITPVASSLQEKSLQLNEIKLEHSSRNDKSVPSSMKSAPEKIDPFLHNNRKIFQNDVQIENLTSKEKGNTDVSISIWVEDKEATRGPIKLNTQRQALVGDLKRQAEAALGLPSHLQRWIVGRTLCTDDNTPLVTLTGSEFNAPFYLCLVETDPQATNASRPAENETVDVPKIVNDTGNNVYKELVQLEQQALVPNAEVFECGVCIEECKPGSGVILRECVHMFCKECLADVVRHSEEPDIFCPAMGCRGVIQEREIRGLVTPEDYERWLARGLAAAESGTRNAFHCRTRDCTGWALCDPGVRRFLCPVCKHSNCVPCQAIHEGETCEKHRAKLQAVSTVKSSHSDDSTRALLNNLINKGEALECPECKAIITKMWGCDWVKCSACKTEICWVTRGRRWGPAGRGDTSAGCRCGVDGKRCHPSCGYCH